MTLRFTTTRAIGVAIALTIGGAATAAAQTTGTGTTGTGTTGTGTTTTQSGGTTEPRPGSGTMTTAPAGSSTTPGGSSTGTMGGTTSGTMSGSMSGGTTTGTPSGVTGPIINGTTTGTPGSTMGGTTTGTTGNPGSGNTGSGMTNPTPGSSSTGSMNGTMGGSTSGSMGGSTGGSMSGSYNGASSRSGVRVRKDQGITSSSSGDVAPAPAPAPAPMPEPMYTPAPETSVSVTETTTTTTTLPPAVPAARPTRFGNGVYLGLGAGANFPQSNINTFYDAGLNLNAQLGWDPTTSPLGLRLNFNYNRLNGRNDFIGRDAAGATIRRDLPNADLYSLFTDAKLRLPFGRVLGSTSGLYAVGGGGVAYFRNYTNFSSLTGINPGQNVIDVRGNNVTRFALNGGAGLSFGVGPVSLFAEGRYVRVFTANRDTDYVPVTVGISFH